MELQKNFSFQKYEYLVRVESSYFITLWLFTKELNYFINSIFKHHFNIEELTDLI